MIIDDKIMNYVLYKMRTEAETRRKCHMLKLEDEYIDEAIEYLKEAGYLDDAKYVRKYIENVMRLKHCSANEIKIDLMRRGIDQDLIESELYTDEVMEFEKESAEYIIQKKLKLGEEPLKIKKYMLNKGYPNSVVSEMLNSQS